MERVPLFLLVMLMLLLVVMLLVTLLVVVVLLLLSLLALLLVLKKPPLRSQSQLWTDPKALDGWTLRCLRCNDRNQAYFPPFLPSPRLVDPLHSIRPPDWLSSPRPLIVAIAAAEIVVAAEHLFGANLEHVVTEIPPKTTRSEDYFPCPRSSEWKRPRNRPNLTMTNPILALLSTTTLF